MAQRKSDMKMGTKADEMKLKEANVLKLIASLFFMFVVLKGAYSPWVTGGYASVWLPLLVAVAALSTIVLFFSSLFGALSRHHHGASGKVLNIAALSLFALTISTAFSGTFWIVVVGYIIGWIGVAMTCTCMMKQSM